MNLSRLTYFELAWLAFALFCIVGGIVTITACLTAPDSFFMHLIELLGG